MKTLITVIALAFILWVSTMAGNAEIQAAGGILTILENVHNSYGFTPKERVAVTFFPEGWTGHENISKLLRLPALKKVDRKELDKALTSIYKLEISA